MGCTKPPPFLEAMPPGERYDLQSIFAGPEYFFCQREHCTLRRAVCVARQRANLKKIPLTAMPFPGCENCAQDESIMKVENSRKPRRGQGQRDLNCQHYNQCLSEVAQKDWKSFSCEICPLFTKDLAPAKPENTRICKLCNKNSTIQPSSPYCASCLALKAKESRAKGKKAIDETPKTSYGNQEDNAALKTEKGLTPTIQEGEIVDSGANMSLTLHFDKYDLLLDKLKTLSEKEVRSVEGQAIFILKTYLDDQAI
jgi:hypothetical protein